MRDLIVVLSILGFVFGGNFFIHSYIDSSGKEFLEKVKMLGENMKAEEKIKKEKIEEILNIWEENEEKWIMIGYHQEINDIEDLLIECYCYYLQGNKNSFEISYRQLKRNVEDLKNREKITFTNIL